MNINGVIEHIKKKEHVQKKKENESIQVLIETSRLKKNNAELVEQITEKQKTLEDLKLQIASKSVELKLKQASIQAEKDAQEIYQKREDDQLNASCKFYEDQWNAERQEIDAIYAEAKALSSKKRDAEQIKWFFQVDAFKINERDYRIVKSQDSILSLSFEDFEDEEFIQKKETSSDKFETENLADSLNNWELQSVKESTVQRSTELAPKSYNARDESQCAARKRQDQFTPNRRPAGGVISSQWSARPKGVAASESLTSSVSSYSQKPVTSAWVTSSFGRRDSEMGHGATASRAVKRAQPTPAATASKKTNFAEQRNWEYALSDFDIAGDPSDDCWAFPDEEHQDQPSPQMTTQELQPTQKRPKNTFQPRKPFMKKK